MWHSSSKFTQSSVRNEVTIDEASESNYPSSAEDTSNEVLPTSRQALICYEIPDVTSSLVSQSLPNNNSIGMNTNTSSSQLRNQRRTYEGQRFQPYRVPQLNLSVSSHSAHCDVTSTENELPSSDQSQVNPSLGAVTKRRRHCQCIERFLNIQQEEESRIVPLESHNLSEDRLHLSNGYVNDLAQSDSNNGSGTMENLNSASRLCPDQRTSSLIERGKSNQNTDTSNVLGAVSGSVLNTVFDCNNTYKRCSNVGISRTINCSPKRYLNFNDDPLASGLRFISDLPLPTANAQCIANNLIKLSRCIKSPNLNDLCCPDCRHIPMLPVTGQCGHTRCMRCTLSNGTCPCGITAPKTMFINTVVREIVEKMMKYVKSPRVIEPGSGTRASEHWSTPFVGDENPVRQGLQYRTSRESKYMHTFSRPWIPMTVQARHHKALELLSAGKFLEAAPHLARVAASTEPCARTARVLLEQTISAMCNVRKPRSVSRDLCQSVREQSARSWVTPGDLECVLCTNTFTEPVCTPCGHTYCRCCVERLLYYKKECALCCGTLDNFSLSETRETVFISSILSSIDVRPRLPLPAETDVIPVVTCNVAFPGMPCPLFIFSPRYCLMVRRVLESGSRRFGMLSYDKGDLFATHGTVLEIRDCVLLEDSRCIVSTVGVSRFNVLERTEKEWCDVARIEPLRDRILTEDEIEKVKSIAADVSCKAVAWLKNLDEDIQKIIETAFGSFPYDDTPGNWWETPDGPNWLWWLIAILPLKGDVKFLILSTPSLLKRIRAVSRTLNIIDTDIFTSNNPGLCDPHVDYWFTAHETLSQTTYEIAELAETALI